MMPDVAKLRQTILQLAVEGKLISQSDDTISDQTLKQISSLEVPKNEAPFDIPSSWRWVQLAALGRTSTGSTPRKSDAKSYGQGLPFIKPDNIKDGINYDTKEHITQYGLSISGNRTASPGDVLMVCIGTIGKTGYVEREVTFNQQINSVSPYDFVDGRYLYTFLSSPVFQNQAATRVSATTIAILNKGKWQQLAVALPPLEEQKRIVEKVETLMALCDELDSKSDNFVETLKKLRQTILQLAMEGKITTQYPSDEPVDNLLERINTNKELPEITENEMKLTIPSSWEWVRIGSISTVKGGKRVPKGETLTSNPTQHVYIRVTDMKDGTVDQSNLQYIEDATFEKISRYTISSDDVYITIAGTIGRVGTIPAELDGSNLTENAAKLVFEDIDKRYLVLAMSSSHIQSQFSNRTIQAAQPKLALKRIELTTLPLPPIEEQRRIVEKVETLMALCDELEKKLSLGLE